MMMARFKPELGKYGQNVQYMSYTHNNKKKKKNALPCLKTSEHLGFKLQLQKWHQVHFCELLLLFDLTTCDC